MPDGKEFQGKKREVDQKIEQIIGLDAGQFTQIAMIAQGDFLRLLHAESKERKKIFSKIFQTQIYRDVQEQLKEQGKALYIQLKENEADIRREMERVDADGSKVQKVWEDLISQEMPSAEAVTETLGRILKEGKEAYETMEAEETALRKESEQLHLMIGKKEEINRIFGLLERTESEYKRLQEQSAEYELLKNHALLGERSEQARRLEVQALRTKEDARRIKEEIVTLNEWMEEHSKRENRLKEDAEQAESEMDRIEPKLREQIVRLREILPRYAKVRKLKAEYEKQTVQMTRCIDQCKAASEDYEEKYRIFFGEQAGILAQELKEGSPCPVCGSVHHPHMLSMLPDLLIGVVVVLVLSASMSTLSSLVLTSSSTLTLDLLKDNIMKKMSEKKQIVTMQVLIVFFIVVSVVIALDPPTFIAQLMGISWGALAGAFLAPFLYGLYWKGVTRAGVWAGFITGVGLTVANMFFGFIKSPINAGAMAMIAGLLIVPFISLITPKLKKSEIEDVFICYDEKVTITKKHSLED